MRCRRGVCSVGRTPRSNRNSARACLWAAWPSRRTSRDRWSFSHPAPRLTSPASSSASMVAIPRGDDAMTPFNFPDLVRNWIDGEPRAATGDEYFTKYSPIDGRALYRVSRSRDGDVAAALAAEGQRLYGRTTTSAVANKYASTVREAMGVAGLVIAANTPVANVAWKVFAALLCGNAAVLKAAEDTPFTAYLFAELAEQAGLPRGVLN